MNIYIVSPSELKMNRFVGDSKCGRHVTGSHLAYFLHWSPYYDLTDATQTSIFTLTRWSGANFSMKAGTATSRPIASSSLYRCNGENVNGFTERIYFIVCMWNFCSTYMKCNFCIIFGDPQQTKDNSFRMKIGHLRSI